MIGTGFLKNLISGKGSEIIESVGNVADKFITTPQERKEFDAEIQKELNRHTEALVSEATKETEMYLNDMSNARAMQITALQQDDKFSKRFVYYLAIGIITMTFGFDTCFFFVDYPARNHDIIMMIAGTLNSTGFAAVIYFFFGSSKGSADKQKQLDKLSK